MANPFDEPDDELVKEGLLCPICLVDFKSINELQEHFDTSHSSDSNTPAKQSGFQLKDLFSKTKNAILRNESNASLDENESGMQAKTAVSGPSFATIWREQMQIGQTRSHFDHFKKIRDSRIERYVIETNKLLIRLDKLITDAPTDPEKRKVHEMSIVHWANNPDVKLCPSCAKSFNLSRRRHHCRLCGGIMCHNCSQFLEFNYARKLISPTNLESSEILALPRVSALQRRGSGSSLLSMINPAGDPHIRVCKDCKVLLDRRDQQIEEKLEKPIVAQMYERMKKTMMEAEKLVPLYANMSYSLSMGETNYHLKDAQELRLKLMKLTEGVDSLSKKVATLGSQDNVPPKQKQMQLQSSIRLGATQFLKETMFSLPSLPSHEELTALQEQRRQEIQRRILYEKQLAIREQNKSMALDIRLRSDRTHVKNNSLDEIVSPDTGWALTPDMLHQTHTGKQGLDQLGDPSVDPMLQQISIIRNYIKQARVAHKYDEVHMLEENLKELEIEYFMQKHANEDNHATNHQSKS